MRTALFRVLIPCAVVVVLVVYILAATRSGVRAYSVDKCLKIDDAKYFPEGEVDYSYFGAEQKLKLRCIRVLRALPRLSKNPWLLQHAPNPVVAFRGKGPCLVIYGRIELGASAQLNLVADNGQPCGPCPLPLTVASKTNTFLWQFDLFRFEDPSLNASLTNGLYHLRHIGETNDLGLVRVKL